jgi:hypothetical protein
MIWLILFRLKAYLKNKNIQAKISDDLVLAEK